MAQMVSTAWTSEKMSATEAVVAASDAPRKSLPKRIAESIVSRADAMTSTDASGMPPVVQFVLHLASWCRAKFSGARAPASSLRLVGHLALGGKKSLVLVEADGIRFLVGGGADSVSVIVPVVHATSGVQENRAELYSRDGDETGKP